MASTQYVAKITLYKSVPFDNTYQNTLRPATIATKKAWLDGNYVPNEKTALMYPKIDTTTGRGTIRLEVTDTLAEDYNYCYINDGKGHERFCFIHGCRYINDGKSGETIMTSSVYEFDLEIDLMMTFLLSNNQFYPAPIDRHHASSSKFNNKRIAEDLPLGTPYVNEIKQCEEYNTNDCWAVIVYTPILNDEGEYGTGGIHMETLLGIPNGTYNIIFDPSDLDSAVAFLNSRIKSPSQIIALYMLPKALVASDYDGHPAELLTKRDSHKMNWHVFSDTPGTLNGYTPRNSKLLYYPYSFARLYNDIGNFSDLKFEDWGKFTSGYIIQLQGTVTMPVSIKASPLFYNGMTYTDQGDTYYLLNNDKTVEISNYPLGSVASDSYAAYIAQNGRSNDTALLMGTGASAAAGIGAILLGSNPVGAAALAIGAVASQVISYASNLQKQMDAPDTTRGSVSNGTIEYYFDHKKFKIAHMSIRSNFARQIDDYFSRYGYSQAGLVDKPDPTIRDLFVYIKTLGHCIKSIAGTSDMNANQLDKVNEIMMNGCTFWNPARVGSASIMQYNVIKNGNQNGDV